MVFRGRLVQANAIDTLFYRFTRKLEDKGLITREGSILDASFVDVPQQRNSKDENDTSKNGEVPEKWKAEGKENMVEQKDLNASWTKKNDETHYEYKNHVKADKDSKLIV
jgi:IS5 family transposase